MIVPSGSMKSLAGCHSASPSQYAERGYTRGEEEAEEEEEEDVRTISEQWFEYLRFLQPTFCDAHSEETGMRRSRGRLAPGEISYRGLVVNHKNNEDMLFIIGKITTPRLFVGRRSHRTNR